MQSKYRTRITGRRNSKVVRLPEELALSLGTTEVILEQRADGILIKLAPSVPSLDHWPVIFAMADTSADRELEDWDVTLQDGLEHQ